MSSSANTGYQATVESDDDPDVMEMPRQRPRIIAPSKTVVPLFGFKNLKEILRVKDHDRRLTQDFVYHQRVIDWFEQLYKTGQSWEALDKIPIRVHTFPLALDRYVGTLFSERGTWENPQTGAHETQYKLPIELTYSGKIVRYVLRYTYGSCWYHRDMTEQTQGIWNNVDFPPLDRTPLSIADTPRSLQIKTKAKTETFDPKTNTVVVDFHTFQITLFRIR